MDLYSYAANGKCRKCDVNCKNCFDESKCSECYAGYALNAHKICLAAKRIGFNICLDMNFELYSTNIISILEDTVRILNLNNSKYIQI